MEFRNSARCVSRISHINVSNWRGARPSVDTDAFNFADFPKYALNVG